MRYKFLYFATHIVLGTITIFNNKLSTNFYSLKKYYNDLGNKKYTCYKSYTQTLSLIIMSTTTYL